jgi:hypothetical protein
MTALPPGNDNYTAYDNDSAYDTDSAYDNDSALDYQTADDNYGADYGAGGARRWPRHARRRRAVATAVAGVVSLAVIGCACMLAAVRQHARNADSARVVSGISAVVGSHGFAAALSIASSGPAATGGQAVTLTARDRNGCPAAAAACVDLAEKITWLQSGGRVTYGPVRMEPGPPGSAHATPVGTFYVDWKGGATLVSNIYHAPIPWAVFFGSGGIAFHEGSLTTSSHGCVHLTMASARYYNQHLPIGAEVVVFRGA